MPTPTRPVTGAAIESAWGQEVHDGLFLPSGGRFTSPASVAGGTFLTFNKGTDPGNWLPIPATNLVVPADGDGLYLFSALFNLTHAAETFGTIAAQVGGADVAQSFWGQGTRQVVHSFIRALTAGQSITYRLTFPTGTGESLLLVALDLVRLGRAYGVA